MLSEEQIREIERKLGPSEFSGAPKTLWSSQLSPMETANLLATVKELSESLKVCRKDKEDYCADLEYFRKKYDAQRELIRRMQPHVDHTLECDASQAKNQPCGCGVRGLEHQIEEALK